MASGSACRSVLYTWAMFKAMNPYEILSLGSIGLGFLLAVMAFRLLTQEQRLRDPRPSILRSTYSFMGFSLILCGMGFTGEIWRSNLAGSRAVKGTPSVRIDVLSARPTSTHFGDAARSAHEIERILTADVPARLKDRCFSVLRDHEVHGTAHILVYAGSSGYANNISVDDSNMMAGDVECLTEVLRGTMFPEPTGSDPTSEYWISARVVVAHE